MIKSKLHWAATLLLLLAVLFHSCSGKATSNGEPETESVLVQDTQTIVARFIAVYPNSQGTIFAFTGVDGQDYDFWESETPAKGMDFIRGLAPNEVNPKFDDILFEVIYIKAKKEFPSAVAGETVTRDVMHIVEIKQLDEAPKTAGITPKQYNVEELKGLIFYGVEPFWDIRLKDTHAEYRDPHLKGVINIYYSKDENDTSKPKLSEVIRDRGNNMVQITGVMKDSPVTFSIVRETCSDGMSDDLHPYSMEFVHGEWGVFKGCGRVNNN